MFYAGHFAANSLRLTAGQRSMQPGLAHADMMNEHTILHGRRLQQLALL
jgi:hypothetical protein